VQALSEPDPGLTAVGPSPTSGRREIRANANGHLVPSEQPTREA
jgi:hypothetical protein